MATAISELKYFPSIPVKVTLDEFIEISKSYSSLKSSAFINGILDKVVALLKDSNQLNKSGRGLIFFSIIYGVEEIVFFCCVFFDVFQTLIYHAEHQFIIVVPENAFVFEGLEKQFILSDDVYKYLISDKKPSEK